MRRARKRSYDSLRGLPSGMEAVFMTQFGKMTSLARQAACDHAWERDGQTLTAVRWTCSKCFKTKLG